MDVQKIIFFFEFSILCRDESHTLNVACSNTDHVRGGCHVESIVDTDSQRIGDTSKSQYFEALLEVEI